MRFIGQSGFARYRFFASQSSTVSRPLRPPRNPRVHHRPTLFVHSPNPNPQPRPLLSFLFLTSAHLEDRYDEKLRSSYRSVALHKLAAYVIKYGKLQGARPCGAARGCARNYPLSNATADVTPLLLHRYHRKHGTQLFRIEAFACKPCPRLSTDP